MGAKTAKIAQLEQEVVEHMKNIAGYETTMLLLCDYQNDILAMNQLADGKDKELVAKVNAVTAAARAKGVHVGFVRVAFRPGHPEVSDQNRLFKIVKANNKLVEGTDGSKLHDDLKVDEGEPVFTKKRVGAFSTTDLQAYLRAKSVTKLVLAGVSTGGVVLTTVREAFDFDYELTVLKDLCHDKNTAQGEALINTVLPNQCNVKDSTEWLASLTTDL